MTKKAFVAAEFIVLMVAVYGLVVFPFPGDEPAMAAAAPAASTEKATGAEGKPPAASWAAPDQEAAKKRAQETVSMVDTVVDECLLCRSQRLRDEGYDIKDITQSYFLLDSPIIKRLEDYYGPVRFMHSKHASLVKDCSVCHHTRPTDKDALETTRCSACHQDSFRNDHPDRIGLKAAYHLNCMGCHEKMAKGPVDCLGCHTKKVPDHNRLVNFPGKPQPTDVTTECLRCHKPAGEDMLKSVHWLWKGHSPYTLEHRKEVQHGKATTALNNF